MPVIASPLPRGDFSNFNESSPQRSLRDTDATGRQWLKQRQSRSQLIQLQNGLSTTNRTVQKIGRRVIGMAQLPSSSQASNSIAPFGFYNIASNGAVAMNNLGTSNTVGSILPIEGGTISPGGSATLITIDAVGAGGSILSAHISTIGSYTTPPTYPAALTGGGGATVTIPSSGDSWRTFQMRDGLVSWRPRHPEFMTLNGPNRPTTFVSFSGSDYVSGGSASLSYGNFEHFLYVNHDFADYLQPLQYNVDQVIGNPFAPISSMPAVNPTSATPLANIVLNNAADVKICGFDSANKPVQFGQILLDNSVPANEMYASFWLEIIDSATGGFYANLWGRMCGNPVSGSAAQGITFPHGTNIIPLAVVQVSGTLSSFTGIAQFNSGILGPRFPSSGEGLLKTYRGAWNFDSLTGQLFYPGDEVIDDTDTSVNFFAATTSGGAVTTQVQMYTVWTFIGTSTNATPASGFYIGTSAPHVDTGNWLMSGLTAQIPTLHPTS